MWITLIGPTGASFHDVLADGSPDGIVPPSGYAFPLGFVNVTLNGLAQGATATVTSILHGVVPFTAVFAYGPTVDDPQPHWSQIPFTQNGDELQLAFTDGAAGDLDLAANKAVTILFALADAVPAGPSLSLLSARLGTQEQVSFRNIGGAWVPHTNQLPVVINTLAWPVSASGYHLQFTDDLSSSSHWTTLPNPSIEINNRHIVTNTVGNQAARFNRLGP